MPSIDLHNYNPDNIFAKIIRKEIPCQLVGENEHALAFRDIAPCAPIHILIIPKGPYTCSTEFHQKASPEEILAFYHLIGKLPHDLDIEKDGFRLISNQGVFGGQEVPHFHVHLMGGGFLGFMISPQ